MSVSTLPFAASAAFPAFAVRALRGLAALALVTTAAFAAQPTPPPVAAAPPSRAFEQASTPGVAEAQGPDDGVVFVDQERKDPKLNHEDSTPVTSLHAESGTARPHR